MENELSHTWKHNNWELLGWRSSFYTLVYFDLSTENFENMRRIKFYFAV